MHTDHVLLLIKDANRENTQLLFLFVLQVDGSCFAYKG